MNKYRVTDYGVVLNSKELQTEAFQKVFDMCKNGGGTVIVPKGKYLVAALRMWSNTTLYLEEGAEIFGSDNCDDYQVFPIPKGMEMRSDMELITQYYGKPWDAYRRAIITAYGEKNISIIGEKDSAFDGQNCYDPNGEEGYRGPHIIFLSCCENVLLQGYIARHSGNFLHEANNCRNLTMRNVTCLGGSDGIHLHCSKDTLIENCSFITGDDCIAGINIENLLVDNCLLNTSCNLFRMGGVNINIKNTKSYGPGYYPHRMTVVKGKNNELPREQGRHNTLALVDYFASTNYPFKASDIHFENCVFDDFERILYYPADQDSLHSGTHLGLFTFKNVTFNKLKVPAYIVESKEEPLTVILDNVKVNFVESAPIKQLFVLDDNSSTTIIEKQSKYI